MQKIRLFSYGGGVQSNAVLVLAAKREIDVKTFVFANTGHDSESRKTLDYIENVARPYAEKHGIEMVEVAKKGMTLYQHAISDKNRTIPIPMRMSNGAPGTRKCTSDWKIKPIQRYAKSLGATSEEKALIGIGISMDEVQRAKDSLVEYQEHEFPLLDLRVSRMECANIIREANLPVPPKSSCWFCPYKKIREWRDLANDEPELFDKACELEAKLEAKRGGLGKDRLYLTDKCMPLADVVAADGQLDLFEAEECSGYCWT